MRIAAVVLACSSGCAHAPRATDAQITRWSHDVLDAYDRGDVAAVERQLAPELVQVEEGEPHDRAHELAAIEKRRPEAPHIIERTWSNEHVFVVGDQAVFIGQAAERSSGKRGGYRYDGRYTLVWRPHGGRWQLALWAWSRAGATAERDTWNDVFRHGTGFETAPNRLLVEVSARERPGSALDIAMGQGRNALYLAEHGWKVTGVDFSSEGIAKARAAAAAASVALDAVEADVETYDFGTAKYDLVTMIYAGADEKTVAKARAALRPGGLFVVEYFHGADGSPQGFGDGQLARLFASGFDILRDDVIDDVPDWGPDHAKLERFVARKR